jgi:hypothetical protein
MANYVAHHTKKKERLLFREDKLLRSIRGGDSRECQLRLAEEVRLARIRAFRSERATFVPTSSGHTERVAVLNARIVSLETTTPEEILSGFIARESRSHNESA